MAVVGKKRKNSTTYYVATFFNGEQYWERSGTDKREAERLDARRKREVETGDFEPAGVAPKKALRTVADYAKHWGDARTNVSAKDDRRNLTRFTALTHFAALPIDEVRPRHIIEALKKLKGTVSPKSLKNAYGTLRTMFRDARIAELVSVDPCVLPRNFFAGEPVAEREAYTRAEAAVLVSHHAIPSPIRALNALCLLAGLREGEACGRRWRDLDVNAAPLWAMSVATQYEGRQLKTRKPRLVPVHPELAGILQAWAQGGFVDLMGRSPHPDDYIVPYASNRARGGHYTRSIYYKAFVACCAAAGIRSRSLHSTRHTMVTLARRGGADRQVLSKVTHNATGEMIDRYTHHEWEPLCHAVMAIGALFDARPTPRRIGDNPGEIRGADVVQNTPMLTESLERTPNEPSSIPGASTSATAKNGSEKDSRQSPRQSDSADFDANPRSSDPDEDAFLGAVAEHAADDRARSLLARPPAKASPRVARIRKPGRLAERGMP